MSSFRNRDGSFDSCLDNVVAYVIASLSHIIDLYDWLIILPVKFCQIGTPKKLHHSTRDTQPYQASVYHGVQILDPEDRHQVTRPISPRRARTHVE